MFTGMDDEPILPLVPPGGRAPEGYSGLLVALRGCGAAAVPKILANPLDSFAATALGRIGPAAEPAVPACARSPTAKARGWPRRCGGSKRPRPRCGC